MNEVQEIEWAQCCVCGSEKKGDLPSTTKGIGILAGPLWKNGLLPFSPAKITTNSIVGEDAT